jgi:hypothetical protein
MNEIKPDNNASTRFAHQSNKCFSLLVAKVLNKYAKNK